jgi:hypothetical protein
VDEQSKSIDYSFIVANIDKLQFKPKKDSPTYSDEDVEKFSTTLLNILANKETYHERILLVCR